MVTAIAFFFTKLAILLQFQRLFISERKNTADMTIKGLILFHSLFHLTVVLVTVFQCVPRSKIWDKSVPGKCIDIYTAFIVIGTVNVVSKFCHSAVASPLHSTAADSNAQKDWALPHFRNWTSVRSQ